MGESEKFDEMVQSFMLSQKGLTEDEKFVYYSYLGSLYGKTCMERKRNYYFYRAASIVQNHKQEICLLLLKVIKNSSTLQNWENLHSKVIRMIIGQEKYFDRFG